VKVSLWVNLMEQNPFEKPINSHTDSQEIPWLIWNPIPWRTIVLEKLKNNHSASQEILSLFFFLKPKSLLLFSQDPAQMNPVCIFPHYLAKIHFNNILPYTPRHSNWSRPFKFPTHIYIYISMRSTCITHPILIYFVALIIIIIIIIIIEKYKLWSSSLRNFSPFFRYFSFLSPCTLLSTLLINVFSLSSSLIDSFFFVAGFFIRNRIN
jgi:hypothetical protein